MNKLAFTFSFFSIFLSSTLSNELKEETYLEISNFENGFFLDLTEFMNSESEKKKKLGKIKNEKITNLNSNNENFLKKIKDLLNSKYIKTAKILLSGTAPLYIFFQKIYSNKKEERPEINLNFPKKEENPELNFDFPKIDKTAFESNFFDNVNNQKINNEKEKKNFFIEKILSGEKIVNSFYHLNEDIKDEILKVLSKNDSLSLDKLFKESNLEKIYSYDEKTDKKITIYFCNKKDGNFKFELDNENGKNILKPILIKNMIIIDINQED